MSTPRVEGAAAGTVQSARHAPAAPLATASPLAAGVTCSRSVRFVDWAQTARRAPSESRLAHNQAVRLTEAPGSHDRHVDARLHPPSFVVHPVPAHEVAA